MSWEIWGQAFAMLSVAVTVTTTLSKVLPIIRDRYFPYKLEDDYTFYFKAKGGKKAVVVLPPEMPEAKQQDAMRCAYAQLGLPPQSHYQVPMPSHTANLWELRRHTTRLFKADHAQAIAIPSEIAYEQPDLELDIQRVGDELRIRPHQPVQ
ncbi:hypothetical protein [Duganella sp. BuS-21]|uniref:hypothetical protein n=1 Tax=Duganella sp. BuS-21 TaxID=2943848 RepID=UPI0035A59A24